MATSKVHKSECGPVICCGAAAVTLDHKAGEPTSIDNFFAAIKGFLKGERPSAVEVAPKPVTVVRSEAVANGYSA